MRPLLVLAVTVLAVLAASAPAEAARLAVHDGHARIRVHAGAQATLTARLNGRDVSKDFGEPRGGVRRLDATLSQGLRHGGNVLRVTVGRPAGRARRTTVRFTVPESARLLGAGRDERAVVGRPIELRGRQIPGAGTRRSPMRWEIVRGPHGRTAAAAAAASGGRLTSDAGPTADFTPTEAGTYTLEISAGDASDTVEIDAGQGPLVPIDTQAVSPTTNEPAIKVGDQYYEAENPGKGTQVLVLDRKTLQRIEDNTWTTVAQIQQDLAGLNDGWLVIVAQRAAMDAPMTGAFTSIGVPAAASTTDSGPGFSAVGVPGLAAGDATWINAPAASNDGVDAGRMTGYLSPDVYDNYGYIPGSQHEDFSYGAAAGSPCRGNDPEGYCHDPGLVGYLVRVQDRHTLADVTYIAVGAYRFYATNGQALSAGQQTQQAADMADYLSGVRPGDVVTIQGVSKTSSSGYLPLVGNIDPGVMGTLAQAIANLGGTRDGFNNAARSQDSELGSKGQPYILVGWQHAAGDSAAEATGAEASFGDAGQSYIPALSGTLRPDSSSQYRPVEVSPAPGVSNGLDDIVLAAPGQTAWPLGGGALRALSSLGDSDPRLGPDPRNAYWTQDLDESDTNSIIEGLRDQTFASGQGFTKNQFTAAKTELIQELRWVGNTRSYLSKLSQPFASSGLDGWAAAQGIADQVYADATTSTNPVVMEWLQFTSILIGFGGPPGQMLSRALQLGMWAYGASADGGPGYSQIKTTADKLGTAFITQAKAAEATFQNMGDVVVSDYAKLKQVGTYGGCNTGASGCPAGLAYSAADRKQVSAGVYRGIELQSWVKLLPLGFPTWDLVPPYASGGAPEDPGLYLCNADSETPFSGFPDATHVSFFQAYNPTSPTDSQFEMFIIAAPVGLFSAKPPGTAILNRVFGPVPASGDPRDGGLGMSLAAYVRKTSPKPWSRTSCRWQ